MKLCRLKQRLFPAVVGCCLFSTPALADETYGWIEEIGIQPWDVEVKAKLDTGALTSSMHAEDIERFKRDGKEWVRFTIEFKDVDNGEQISKRMERPMYRDFIAVGAGGEDHRPVVLMKICIGKTIYEEQFSLRDRDGMIYPVLLGRRTIQHLGTVDVTRTFLHEPACDSDSTALSYSEQESDEDIGID